MNDEQAADFLGALANPTRLAIVRCLVRAGPAGAPAGVIASSAGASPSRASFHLSALSELGVITAERQSRSIIYRINFEHLGAVLSYFIEDCCAGNPTLRAACRTC